MNLDFLKDFNKEIEKMEYVGGISTPPSYWYSTGNFVLNKIISGSFFKGIPQGRITTLAGPSGSGKSFLLCNIIRSAQESGAFNLVIDSENALDDDFVSKIGVDPEKNYLYAAVMKVSDTSKLVSSFIKKYKKAADAQDKPPRVNISIDSLDMLMTESEVGNYESGITKGDQGQKNKQLKAMLRPFVQSIKGLNISMVNTAQVYPNQDLLNGEGKYIIGEAIKYSSSQILLITKLKLRKDKVVTGIRMKVEGYKTRFTRPFQTITIEVPYESGMDPYSGLLEVAKDQGLITGKGWYTIESTGDKFQGEGKFAEYAPIILEDLKKKEDETFCYIKNMEDTDGEERIGHETRNEKRERKIS